MRRAHLALRLALLGLVPLAPLGASAQLAIPYGAAIPTEQARKATAAALAEGKKNGWTVAVAVVDPAGTLVYFERLDGTQNASSEVAQAKARSAATFKRPTKTFEEALSGPAGTVPPVGRLAVLGLPGAVPLDGGLPIIVEGRIVGAIGVSGATSAQDGQCAKAGVEALAKP